MKALTETQLFHLTPSIFASRSSESTSSKYALIPTIDCVRALDSHGYKVVAAQQTRARSADNKAYTKHMLRFRREENLQRSFANKEECEEIILVNSHDGKSSYQLKGGIFRFVCCNGLVIGDTLFHQKVRHQGNVVQGVIEAFGQIIDVLPKAKEKIEAWKGIELKEDAKRVYAESAMLLKYDKDEMPFDAGRLIRPRRMEDAKSDLWTTFNAVQENMIRGGIAYVDRKTDERGYTTKRWNSTRRVGSVSENVRLNTALWSLTEKMGELCK